jgi:dTDP-4-amino-4,6-dideoxygalactose transaminase
MGDETLRFEEELSKYLGANEVVTVNSCTSALFLSLLVEGVGKNDEVIVPSLTWCASVNAILYLGATPVFCDIDEKNMCADINSIQEKITNKTKAIIVVHYGGFSIDIEFLKRLLPKKISIIEDAAHAFGGSYPNGKKVGTSKNSVCFSFYANKNLSTGEGGAIALFDENKANKLRKLRNNGLEKDAWKRYLNINKFSLSSIDELGYKMNFTDLQASIGRVQLRRMNDMNKQRSKLINYYINQLEKVNKKILFQEKITSKSHAKHLFVMRVNKEWSGLKRDEFLKQLRSKNIGATIHYKPLHLYSLYKEFDKKDLKITNKIYSEILTLPISASLKIFQIDIIINEIKNIIKKNK